MLLKLSATFDVLSTVKDDGGRITLGDNFGPYLGRIHTAQIPTMTG